jgi:glycosyltransferase involved in cell wall biosynthesis
MHGAGQGGVENSIRTLCKYLDKETINPLVAVPADGPLRRHLTDLGIQTMLVPIELWTPILFDYHERHYFRFLSRLQTRVGALVSLIKDHDIDIVHSSTLSIADGALAARIAGKPHVWHIHGTYAGGRDEYDSFGSYVPVETLYGLVDALSEEIVAVSEDVRQFLRTFLPERHIRVIYNGIGLEDMSVDAFRGKSIREELHLDGKRLVVLVGRVARVKGVRDYVKAAEEIARKRNDTAFLIVGPDEDAMLAKDLKESVRAKHLSDSIIFTGRRTDIPSILKEADVFVCSSKSEGLPYSCLEAMAASKPIVTTKCGGPEELVLPGETGFHVEVGNSAELVQALTLLLDDRRLTESMGRKSRQLVEERFGAAGYARNFEELYESMRAKAGRGATNPWSEVYLKLISDIGDLGTRMIRVEHDIRDLRSFEALFKDNRLYRGLRNILKRWRRE